MTHIAGKQVVIVKRREGGLAQVAVVFIFERGPRLNRGFVLKACLSQEAINHPVKERAIIGSGARQLTDLRNMGWGKVRVQLNRRTPWRVSISRRFSGSTARQSPSVSGLETASAAASGTWPSMHDDSAARDAASKVKLINFKSRILQRPNPYQCATD